MMRFIAGLIIGILIFFAVNVSADLLNSPPPISDAPPDLQRYLEDIFRNWQKLSVTTTNPDGTQTGVKGQMLHLVTGGKYYLCINTDGSTTWRAVELTDTP